MRKWEQLQFTINRIKFKTYPRQLEFQLSNMNIYSFHTEGNVEKVSLMECLQQGLL